MSTTLTGPGRRKTPMLIMTTSVFLLVIAGLYHISTTWIHSKYVSRTKASQAIVLHVKSGMSLKTFSKLLAAKELIQSPMFFHLWVKLSGRFKKVQAGTYQLLPPVSPSEIMNLVESGKTFQPVIHQVVIPEGFTLKKIVRRLVRHKITTSSELLNTSRDREFLKELGIQGDTLEGFLYPATYSFYSPTVSAKEVFSSMVAEFFDRLPATYIDDCKARGISLYDAVTIASLIEKETTTTSERRLVSEVIWNRLNKKVPLGIDASIIYGIPNFKGNLTRKHLKDRLNPYNSRVHSGLPPSPIGSPSLASLKAALEPSSHGYMYYVLIPGGGKRHHFSKTLREHNRHVKRLVRAQRGRRNRK